MGAVPDPTTYDEQIGMTFTQSFTSMAYNVTAIKQSDGTTGVGPAYLLNGLSDTGYWYQVGVSYDWEGTTTYTNYTPGFNFNYEVFDSTGNSVFPTNGGSGSQRFSGKVQAGDTILLNLYFSNTYGVVMLAKDYNTGASAFETYNAEGGHNFIGLSSEPVNSNGFFTGLMTEWYHPTAFYGNVSPVRYTNPNFALTSAWMWIDEYSCSDTSCSSPKSLFSDSTPAPVSYFSPSKLHEFSSNGATEYSNAYKLITGPAYWDMIVSYSVSGGSTGYSQPIFQYTYNGVPEVATLTEFPVTYIVDAEGSWEASSILQGTFQGERWALTGSSFGVASSTQTINFEYQHQFQLSVSGGSEGSKSTWVQSASTAFASTLGVFDRAGGSGQRVVSYSLDGSSTEISPTIGTINLPVLMNSPHQVIFTSVKQYELSTPTGNISSMTPPSIPGDSAWYDIGSSVMITYSHSWNITARQSRVVATAYSVNGDIPTSVPEMGNGTFAVPLQMSSPETVNVMSTTQYYLTFTIANGTGQGSLASASFGLRLDNQTQVNGMSIWLDNGTSITIPSITYEGVNVSPSHQTVYEVVESENITLNARVYDAKVRVTDILGLPVGGAEVTMTLANGTSITGETNSGGFFAVSNVPLGTYSARIASLGLTSQVSGDASTNPVFQVRGILSVTVIALLTLLLVAIVVVALSIKRTRSRHKREKSEGSESLSMEPSISDTDRAHVCGLKSHPRPTTNLLLVPSLQ